MIYVRRQMAMLIHMGKHIFDIAAVITDETASDSGIFATRSARRRIFCQFPSPWVFSTKNRGKFHFGDHYAPLFNVPIRMPCGDTACTAVKKAYRYNLYAVYIEYYMITRYINGTFTRRASLLAVKETCFRHSHPRRRHRQMRCSKDTNARVA